jgi:hypothetical protein
MTTRRADDRARAAHQDPPRLFFAEHWRVGTIAVELGVHHDTVRRAIEADRFIRPDALVRPSMLDPYKAFLAETLERHPRLRATRLFEMARDRGYRGSLVQLRRHVATVRPAPRGEAYLRLQTLPGEQAQVDWGHFGTIRVGHAKRSLACFVMVLSWSRAVFARFALDQTLESFLRGHVEAFAAYGGVPRSILSADPFIEALAVRGEHLGGHVARLLKLLDRVGPTELELALKDALDRGAVGAASVAHVLDQRARARKAAPVLDVVLPADPRVRDLRVTPHALDSYDALAKPTKETT